MITGLILFIVGILLTLGLLRFYGLLGGLAGVVLILLGSLLIWGADVAVFVTGLSLSYWTAAIKNYILNPVDAPLIVYSLNFPIVYQMMSILAGILIIVGLILLIL